jgi:hypothetical protein
MAVHTALNPPNSVAWYQQERRSAGSARHIRSMSVNSRR